MKDEERFLQYIWDHWPELRDYVPHDLVPFFGRVHRRVKGLCSDLDVLEEYWFDVRGGKRFCSNTPTAPFYCVSLRDSGSEFLVVMWHRDDRSFWFSDRYWVCRPSSKISPEKTGESLDQALARWDNSTGDVICSSDFGWFDSETCLFEKDSPGKRLEEWDFRENRGDDFLTSKVTFERIVPPSERSQAPDSETQGRKGYLWISKPNDPDNFARRATMWALGGDVDKPERQDT